MTTNPYQPPTSSGAQETSDSTVSDQAGPARTASFWSWFFVLAVNLPMPAFFSLAVIGDSGARGIVLAVLGFFGCGWVVCWTAPKVARRLIAGAWVVAVTQVFPIIQMFAGMMALELARALFKAVAPQDPTPVGIVANEFVMFFVTIVTGGILAIVSMALGSIVILIKDRPSGRSVTIKDLH